MRSQAEPGNEEALVYKLLLSWRYLRTRYIALASIISVTLGVGTLIVVNSVMAGFTREMHVRLHGILSDVIVDTERFAGFAEHPESMMRRIAASPAGKHVAAMAPTVEVVGTERVNPRLV